MKSSHIDRVIVSTDSEEIAAAAERYGAEIPFMRPAHLATDEAPEWAAWQHAISALRGSNVEMDVFVCVPPTAPLRAVEDVDACIEELVESDAELVLSVKPAERNPSFNMVTIDGSGYAGLATPPAAPLHRRQDAPSVFDVTTVAYAARPDFVLASTSIFEGRVRAVVVPAERAIDIDTELDLEFAEFLLSRAPTGSRHE